VEAAAEAFDVDLVEFALAAEDLGDDAGGAEDVGGVFLQEAVLVDEELEDFERLGSVPRVRKFLFAEQRCVYYTYIHREEAGDGDGQGIQVGEQPGSAAAEGVPGE
jgi:hypothetical protein